MADQGHDYFSRGICPLGSIIQEHRVTDSECQTPGYKMNGKSFVLTSRGVLGLRTEADTQAGKAGAMRGIWWPDVHAAGGVLKHLLLSRGWGRVWRGGCPNPSAQKKKTLSSGPWVQGVRVQIRALLQSFLTAQQCSSCALFLGKANPRRQSSALQACVCHTLTVCSLHKHSSLRGREN